MKGECPLKEDVWKRRHRLVKIYLVAAVVSQYHYKFVVYIESTLYLEIICICIGLFDY